MSFQAVLQPVQQQQLCMLQCLLMMLDIVLRKRFVRTYRRMWNLKLGYKMLTQSVLYGVFDPSVKIPSSSKVGN